MKYLNVQPQPNVEFVNHVESYLYQQLLSMKGMHIAVQTPRSTLQGVLTMITPDHIVLDVHGTPFFIRNQQIIWVTQAL